ncbi:leucine rich protein [Anopheles darlingi]|uniref:Leucine rich protein n=1 Tax=Anopheles darlingi TaxID=43151 RepID=W5J877_ANODA|nr:leucine rich protein [Anopheles darlingi]
MHLGIADTSVLLVLIMMRTQLCCCLKYTCTVGSDGFCIFQGVHIETVEQAQEVQLEPPAVTDGAGPVTRVKFRDSSMFMLPTRLYSAFRQLQELRVWWMQLHSIHIDARLLTLDAEKNRISSITADPDTVPLLRKLELSQNRLRNIDNISHFEHLEVLELGHNDLRTLDLCVLQRMQRLRLLDLSSNNLALVKSSLGHEKLPALTVLYLNDNRLTYLDLGILRAMPALEKLHIANNALVYVDNYDNLPALLPRLRSLQIYDNDWHCEALADVLGQLRKMGVQEYKAYSAFNCKDRSVEGVCCTDNKPFALVRKSHQYISNYATELNGHARYLARELHRTRHEVHRLVASENFTQSTLQMLGDEVDELRSQLSDLALVGGGGAADIAPGNRGKVSGRNGAAGDQPQVERLATEMVKLRRDYQKLTSENQSMRQQVRQYEQLKQEVEQLRLDSVDTKLELQLLKEQNAMLRHDLQKLQQLFSLGANV